MHQPRNVLVTGGSGFIGCNFIRHVVEVWPEARIVNLDALTYAGNPANLEGLERSTDGRYRFVHGDITDASTVGSVFDAENIDTVVHFAAESHVDRSIDGPAAFLQTNIMGTYVLLDVARASWANRDDVRFHHVSTDEVFGSLGAEGYFTETTPYDPSSPYSASKASADHLVRAWGRTFGLRYTLSNCSNNYGPYQFPEKLIPLMIHKGLRREALPVYGDGMNVRDWLHVQDHCSAIARIIEGAPNASTWCVSGDNECTNLSIVQQICDLLDERDPGASSRRDLITFVTDRPGHDRRYAIDARLLREELGWCPARTFEVGLAKTIDWYLQSSDWVHDILSGEYRGERLGTT